MKQPSYYANLVGTYTAIDVISGFLSREEYKGFCKGNILKYILRAGRKEHEPAASDYRKAMDYMEELLNMEEQEEESMEERSEKK